jgi:hypothetical protein
MHRAPLTNRLPAVEKKPIDIGQCLSALEVKRMMNHRGTEAQRLK